MPSPLAFLSLRIVVYPGVYTSESAMDWLNLVSVTIAMSALMGYYIMSNFSEFVVQAERIKAATGPGYLPALVGGRLSSLFVSALLASVRCDGERWSFLLLLPLAGVTAGAVTSSSTPDIKSL